MTTALYLYNRLDQAPDLALNALPFYTQSVNYLKDKTTHLADSCRNKIQDAIRIAYPILRNPRQSTARGFLSSTKYVANLSGIGTLYKKACFVLSRRAGRAASIEGKILLHLKELSSYCCDLNVDLIPWQKLPEMQTLDHLKQQLQQTLQRQNTTRTTAKITKAIACCDEICVLLALHHSARTSELNTEELETLQRNAGINSMISAIGENTGEALGSYTPQILGPFLAELLAIIPDSYNPLLSVSNSVAKALKKLLVITIGASSLAITSTNYFVSLANRRALLQASTLSGVIATGLYYQNHPLIDQIEDGSKEITQLFLEIICSYAGMKLFGTDESFNGYLYKIVPAVLASKATESLVSGSCVVTSFALPLLVSSIVYNQADIRNTTRENCKSLMIFLNMILNSEIKTQILQLIASSLTSCLNNNISNMASENILQNSLSCISPSLTETSCKVRELTPRVLKISSMLSIMQLPEEIREQVFTISELASFILEIERDASHALNPLFFPIIDQTFTSLSQEQLLKKLNSLSSQYLAILQQDDVQDLLVRIQQRICLLDLETEELKNQLLKEIFLKRTKKELPLNDTIFSLLKKNYEIYPSLFTSFKHAPAFIRMLWNSYSYDKKIEQALMLELLLQGFAINALAHLHVTLDLVNGTSPELPPVSYLKLAVLGKKLIL